jgi:protein-disulfide isomerase
MTISRRTLLGVGAGVAVVAGAGAAWFARDGSSVVAGTAPAAPVSAAPAGGAGLMSERAIGRADAPVEVREFFSLTCSHCATFHRDTLPRIKKEMVDTGRVWLIFHDFPLDQIALTAAAVARHLPPASYEPFVGALLASQERWAFARGVNTTEELAKIAALAGMPRAAFDAAVADQGLRTEILKARDEAARTWGIDSTPSFIINGPALKNQRVAGARPYDDFARLVQQAAG